MNIFTQSITRFLNDEEGASAIEYALIVGLVSLALVAALGLVGASVSSLFTRIGSALNAITL